MTTATTNSTTIMATTGTSTTTPGGIGGTSCFDVHVVVSSIYSISIYILYEWHIKDESRIVSLQHFTHHKIPHLWAQSLHVGRQRIDAIQTVICHEQRRLLAADKKGGAWGSLRLKANSTSNLGWYQHNIDPLRRDIHHINGYSSGFCASTVGLTCFLHRCVPSKIRLPQKQGDLWSFKPTLTQQIRAPSWLTWLTHIDPLFHHADPKC